MTRIELETYITSLRVQVRQTMQREAQSTHRPIAFGVVPNTHAAGYMNCLDTIEMLLRDKFNEHDKFMKVILGDGVELLGRF